MFRVFCCYLATIFLICLHPSPSSAATEDGLALVIGNSKYQHASELNNPGNDAEEIAASLKSVGFKVIKGIDLDKAGMDENIKEFARKLKNFNKGLFYYAGHGVQIKGENYLVPVDAKLEDTIGIDFEVIPVKFIQRVMERSTNTNLIFLDACRNNPLARNLARSMGTRSVAIGRGLAPIESGSGTLISFSTQPGNVALDGGRGGGGGGENSPYATALSKQIRLSNGDISEILINVRREVMNATGNRQVPWEHSALTSRFFFKEQAKPAPAEAKGDKTKFDQEAELAFWNSVKDSKRISLFQTYLTQYPSGKFSVLARELIYQLEKDKASTESSPSSSEKLATTLQRELKRVGCYDGVIDGKWQDGSERAMKNYNNHSKTTFATDKPNSAAIEAVSRTFTRICPETKPRIANTRSQNTGRSSRSAPQTGGYRTCGRNGCQWVPKGCTAIRGGGGGGLGGRIVCP